VLTVAPNRAPSDLATPGVTPQLLGDLDHLAHAGGPDRVTSRHQTTAGVDHQATATDGSLTSQRGRARGTELVEAERLEGVQLLGAGGVVKLDDVDVVRADRRLLPRLVGRLPYPHVVLGAPVT